MNVLSAERISSTMANNRREAAEKDGVGQGKGWTHSAHAGFFGLLFEIALC